MNSEKWAIIVAAGRGSRFGGDVPKQFVILKDKPVLWFSLDVFFKLRYNIIVVIHPDDQSFYSQLSTQFNFPPHQVVLGGEQRFHSVQNALSAIQDNEGFVAIHDAARPNIDTDFIQRLENSMNQHMAVVPAIPIADSIRMKIDNSWKAVPREEFRVIQTPQFFQIGTLKDAYKQDYQSLFTDDASVVESNGVKIELAEGKQGNIKITFDSDLHGMNQLLAEV